MKNRFFITFQSLILITVFSLIICSNANANWWDKFGEPKYGGKLNIQIGRMPAQIDTIIAFPAFYLYEPLFNWDWTLDQEKEYSYTNRWVPPEYWTGNLAETWEWEDSQTVVIRLRKGIHWQDKPPLNGREFTAHDVAHHYHRLMGNGSGYTKPSPTLAPFYAPYDKVTAIDDYTVVIKFKKPSIVVNTMNLFDPILQNFEPPEVAKEVEIIKDWRKVVSTGPWILTDFVEGGAVTLTRNPNYWAYDEKFPKNRLPYLDEVRILSISDIATAISALRTNKLSILSELTWQQSDTLSKSNPEFQKAKVPRQAPDLQLRVDKKPFTDIRVRKALQLAFDRQLIAKTYFGGMSEGKPCGIMWPDYEGWVMPYDEWPQSLKDEYSYNPEKAKKLLSEAGYPDGFKTHVAADSTGDLALLEIIKAQFLDIGVDMEIRAMDGHALRSMLNSHKLEQIYYQWSPAGQPPSIAVRTVATNHPHLQHGDMNYVAIVEEFEKANSLDEAKKRAIDADMYYLNQHWSIVLFPTYSFTFWQPNLKGYIGERNTLTYLGTPAQGALSWARLWISE